jgi:beta-glucosidase/6-phospho-beta-glucosidase/beta-galactosidase
MSRVLIERLPHKHSTAFLFATGIENSYPTILENGKMKRVDEMEKTFHYTRWREDFSLVQQLGLQFLRYGPPYYKTHVAPGKYDWSFTDETLTELKRLKITPIVDLCHFGVPDWLGNFQNPDFPQFFAEYAQAFSQRYDWVRFYTPVNEIFIAARFSALLGWWNECLKGDKHFVNALKHLVQANIRAEQSILKVKADAVFIQSESTEYFHYSHQSSQDMADFYNELRFLPLDLSYGTDVRGLVYEYLLDNGMTRSEYHWFLENGRHIKSHCIMGNDYYLTNEHLVHPDGRIEPSGEIFGYYVLTRQYSDRYHLPVMHTETNINATDEPHRAVDWLWKEWANMLRLKQDGVTIVGFTWYSLIDQVDWDSWLCKDQGHVNPLGLYDLDRKIRPVGEAYRKLVQQWRNLLPTESIGLNPL